MRGVFSFFGLLPCFFYSVSILSGAAWGLSISTGPDGSNVQALHALGYIGQGVKVGLISRSHARYTHEAFDGAVSWYDATGENRYEIFSHDTSMAGIICSRGGDLYPDCKGAAPGAEVLSVRVTRVYNDNRAISLGWVENALNHIKNGNGRVVVTGIQLDNTADGNCSYSLLYDYYAYEQDMIFAAGAGNRASSITVFGDTFNSITTAGLILEGSESYNQVGTWSNPGPTVDGRRKPEIAAPAQRQWVPTSGSNTAWKEEGAHPRGETSWAVAHTAGVAATLLSYADTTNEPNDGRSEVIKAVIVNSTFPNINDKAGNWTDPNQFTWHAHRGYGRIDALRAFKTLSAPKISADDPNTLTHRKGWAYEVFNQNGFIHDYRIEGSKSGRLITTITWHRKVSKSGSSYIRENPVLNLAVSIIDPQGREIFSESGDGNNLRKADLFLEADGAYTIQVKKDTAWDSANRAYALAFEVLEPLQGDLNNDYVVDGADLSMLFDGWLLDEMANPSGGGNDLATFGILSSQWQKVDLRYCRL